LIADDTGRFYVAVSASGLLTAIQPNEAEDLIQDRTYRRWNGEQAWTELERLPLLDSTFAQHDVAADALGDEGPL
jgi:hypothetical protein